VKNKTFLVGLMLMVCASVVRAQVPASPLTTTETEVVRFMPEVPGGKPQKGSCWTESIAVSRSGAWRCTVGNGISDPCFTIAGKRGQLVCGANPALKSDGFILKLTKPLPKSTHAEQKVEPWIFRLADNSVCEAMTGTLSPVNDEPARWACAIHIRDQVRPAGLVTALTPGKVWTADKFPESAIGKEGVKPEKVPVKVIWE
jgi:hypothetical protein